jgi:hypothetical protein
VTDIKIRVETGKSVAMKCAVCKTEFLDPGAAVDHFAETGHTVPDGFREQLRADPEVRTAFVERITAIQQAIEEGKSPEEMGATRVTEDGEEMVPVPRTEIDVMWNGCLILHRIVANGLKRGGTQPPPEVAEWFEAFSKIKAEHDAIEAATAATGRMN